jgi:hypothetical protein
MQQFDESSDNYRCCCQCFHIKTATIFVACIELIFLLIFLINSLLILAVVTGGGAPGVHDELRFVIIWTLISFIYRPIQCRLSSQQSAGANLNSFILCITNHWNSTVCHNFRILCRLPTIAVFVAASFGCTSK